MGAIFYNPLEEVPQSGYKVIILHYLQSTPYELSVTPRLQGTDKDIRPGVKDKSILICQKLVVS